MKQQTEMQIDGIDNMRWFADEGANRAVIGVRRSRDTTKATCSRIGAGRR